MAERPLVSIVIAAYNERAHIARCLSSLQQQRYEPLEVIVVDDGSRDRTVDIARSFDGVQVVQTAHRGAAAARNEGARRAHGEIYVFLDADMTFPPPFVDRLVAPLLADPAEVGTFTREILVANTDRRWARAHQLGRGLPLDTHFKPGFPDRWEIFRSIRASAFWSVGGFDEVGHGEDVTLGRKLGTLAVVAPGAACHHYEPEDLRDIFRSARWLGRGERVREKPNALRDHNPVRALRRGIRLARQHRRPSLLLYRLVWDSGVAIGLLQGRSVVK
jgi:GT2 family glycosyltransferase